MTTLKEQLATDLTKHLRAGDELEKSTLRMALSAIQSQEKAGKVEQQFDDAQVKTLLNKEVKKRHDTAEEFLAAAEKPGTTPERAALLRSKADREAAEAGVLATYLPKPLDADALARLVDETIASTGASSMKDMGTVIKAVTAAAGGVVDGKAVSGLVKARLQG